MDPYIDMHIHILPGVDDGANDENEMKEMLKLHTKRVSAVSSQRHIIIPDAERNHRKYCGKKQRRF